jgi:hypothetical protein
MHGLPDELMGVVRVVGDRCIYPLRGHTRRKSGPDNKSENGFAALIHVLPGAHHPDFTCKILKFLRMNPKHVTHLRVIPIGDTEGIVKITVREFVEDHIHLPVILLKAIYNNPPGYAFKTSLLALVEIARHSFPFCRDTRHGVFGIRVKP